MYICVSVFIYVSVSVGVCIYTYGYILVCFPLTYPFSCLFVFFFLFTLSSRFHSDLRDHNDHNHHNFCLFCLFKSLLLSISTFFVRCIINDEKPLLTNFTNRTATDSFSAWQNDGSFCSTMNFRNSLN